MKNKIFIITIIVLLSASFWFLIDNINKSKDVNILEKNIETCKNNDKLKSTENNNYFGYISGILDLGPEDLIQNGMYICAKDINTKRNYCTSELINNYNNSGKRGYELLVPQGTYQLAGIYPYSIDPSYPLKEFKYGKCIDGICGDDLVPFAVSSNEKIENINLNNSGTSVIFKDFNIYKN